MDPKDLALLITAVTGLVAAGLSGAAALLSAWAVFTTRSTAATLAGVSANVRTIEVNTNSLTNALVRKTGEAAFSEGVLAEKKKQGDTGSPPRDEDTTGAVFVRRRV